MLTATSDYEVRLIELQYLRNQYVPLINNFLLEWNKSHVAWPEDIETAFEWMVREGFSRILRCPVISHFHSDIGKFLYTQFPDIEHYIGLLVEQLRLEKRPRSLRHLKMMTVGNILVVGMLFEF